MDVEAWIIGQLELIISPPDAPGEATSEGPASLIVRAEIDWFEADGPDGACRGVDVAVRVAGEWVGSFAYTVSENGGPKLMDHLEPDQVARVAAAASNDPWTRLKSRDCP